MATLASGWERRQANADRRQLERQRPPLRIALLADGATQPSWLVEALSRVAAAGFAEIALIAVCPGRRSPQPWLWRAYRRLDQWLFGAGREPSAPTALRASIPAARYLTLPAPPAARIDAWRQASAASQPLDVVFALGEVDDDAYGGVSRYGVWRYCFGDRHGIGEALAGWREVADGEPVTESGLCVSLRPGQRRLLYRSRSRTNPFSVAKNRANLLSKTMLFAERELRQLHRLGGGRVKRGDELPAAASPAAEAPPGAGETLRAALAAGRRIVRRGLQKLTHVDQWFIAYRFGDVAWDGNLDRYTQLRPAKDRLWADPFPLERDGRHFIFFEEVLFASGKGHIAVIEVRRDGSHGDPVTVLERDYHLSYPFLIEDDGELYMVPESGQNRSVELYRCLRFPDRWQLEKVLLADVACADATFHHDGERWWMFVNIGADGSELYDELHLYHADRLLGDWQAHPCNPVKSDVCGARPAGRLFFRDGALHRPAQICAPLYGSGMVIAEVLELTPRAYREREVAHLFPVAGSGILGIHTLNRSGDLTVVDGFARRRRL
ncbi:MAG TPA: hypothetical protein VFY24_01285 [Azospira sp.]|nr:hypothetical protein [Azospira sp.]